MKRTFTAIITACTLSFFSCDKENDTNPIEGQWYIRTKIEQIATAQATTTTMYKVYKRIDVGSKRYVTFNFTGNNLITEEYTRDLNLNKDIVIRHEYEYRVSGDKIILKDKTGKETTYNFSFMGLSSKNLKLEFLENIMDPNEGQLSKSSKVLLIREFPIDDSEGEVLPPPPGMQVPTEAN